MRNSNEIAVYLIMHPTGLKDEEGVDIYITVDVKLTRASADAVAGRTPGAKVEKLMANKTTE